MTDSNESPKKSKTFEQALKDAPPKKETKLDEALQKSLYDVPADMTLPDMGTGLVKYTPADMFHITEKMATGGYTDIEEANQALKVMFSHSHDMLAIFEKGEELMAAMHRHRDEAERTAGQHEDAAQAIGVTLREIISLVRETAGDHDLLTACARAETVMEAMLSPITPHETNMIAVAAALRELAKGSLLRGLGAEPRKRVVYICESAAAFLDQNRREMLGLRKVATEMLEQSQLARQEIEAATTGEAAPARPKDQVH